MKHTLAVTSAVVVVSTAVSAIVNLKDSCRSIYSWQEKGAFSRFLGSSPACVQSWDAEREMVPRRLRFSLELVENSPSLGCCELIRAHDWPIADKGSYHWINTLSVSARRRAYLASGWWLACCFKALHWRIRVLSSPSHHLMFDVANYTLTSVYVSRSLSKEKQSSQFVFVFFSYLLTTTRLDGEKFVEHVHLSRIFCLSLSPYREVVSNYTQKETWRWKPFGHSSFLYLIPKIKRVPASRVRLTFTTIWSTELFLEIKLHNKVLFKKNIYIYVYYLFRKVNVTVQLTNHSHKVQTDKAASE